MVIKDKRMSEMWRSEAEMKVTFLAKLNEKASRYSYEYARTEPLSYLAFDPSRTRE